MKPLPIKIPLILASVSPRRRHLLKESGYRFRVVSSHVSERISKSLSPSKMVTSLALRKALAVSKRYPNCLVLAADTIVFIDGKVIGKPRDPSHAKKLLLTLSGRWQKVYTGVAVVCKRLALVRSSFAVSSVKMRSLKNDEINHASTKHLDKAGAYAVQEKDDQFVEKIIGDYDNVVGLPMRVVRRLLRLA